MLGLLGRVGGISELVLHSRERKAATKQIRKRQGNSETQKPPIDATTKLRECENEREKRMILVVP
eukprot:374807-Amphidinium_carterae.1